jgi:hypothetical protein
MTINSAKYQKFAYTDYCILPKFIHLVWYNYMLAENPNHITSISLSPVED